MTDQQEHAQALTHHQEYRLAAALTTGSTSEAVGGAAAIVLAILGLAGIQAAYMMPIATIAIGAALVVAGAAVMADYSDVFAEIASTRGEKVELGGGVTAEFLGGAAGIVLGILALIGLAPPTLGAVAVIVFGGALLLGSGATARLRDLKLSRGPEHGRAEHLAREATLAASGAQVLVALAAIALGILALTGIQPATLTLVALLALGSSIVLSGSAVTSKLLGGLRS